MAGQEETSLQELPYQSTWGGPIWGDGAQKECRAWVGEGKRVWSPGSGLCPSHPSKFQRSGLLIHLVSAKVEGGPTEGGATGHRDQQRAKAGGTSLAQPLHFTVGGGEEEEEEAKAGEEEVRARTRQKRAPPEGSPSSRGAQGGPPGERVAGSFCRLPVAPRQSRSRAAGWLLGFPTGRPGGWDRGGTSPSCTNAPAPPLPGQVQRVPPCPQPAAGPGTPGGPAEGRPGFSASQPAPGVRSLRPGFQRGKRLEGPSHPKEDRH